MYSDRLDSNGLLPYIDDPRRTRQPFHPFQTPSRVDLGGHPLPLRPPHIGSFDRPDSRYDGHGQWISPYPGPIGPSSQYSHDSWEHAEASSRRTSDGRDVSHHTTAIPSTIANTSTMHGAPHHHLHPTAYPTYAQSPTSLLSPHPLSNRRTSSPLTPFGSDSGYKERGRGDRRIVSDTPTRSRNPGRRHEPPPKAILGGPGGKTYDEMVADETASKAKASTPMSRETSSTSIQGQAGDSMSTRQGKTIHVKLPPSTYHPPDTPPKKAQTPFLADEDHEGPFEAGSSSSRKDRHPWPKSQLRLSAEGIPLPPSPDVRPKDVRTGSSLGSSNGTVRSDLSHKEGKIWRGKELLVGVPPENAWDRLFADAEEARLAKERAENGETSGPKVLWDQGTIWDTIDTSEVKDVWDYNDGTRADADDSNDIETGAEPYVEASTPSEDSVWLASTGKMYSDDPTVRAFNFRAGPVVENEVHSIATLDQPRQVPAKRTTLGSGHYTKRSLSGLLRAGDEHRSMAVESDRKGDVKKSPKDPLERVSREWMKEEDPNDGQVTSPDLEHIPLNSAGQDISVDPAFESANENVENEYDIKPSLLDEARTITPIKSKRLAPVLDDLLRLNAPSPLDLNQHVGINKAESAVEGGTAKTTIAADVADAGAPTRKQGTKRLRPTAEIFEPSHPQSSSAESRQEIGQTIHVKNTRLRVGASAFVPPTFVFGQATKGQPVLRPSATPFMPRISSIDSHHVAASPEHHTNASTSSSAATTSSSKRPVQLRPEAVPFTFRAPLDPLTPPFGSSVQPTHAPIAQASASAAEDVEEPANKLARLKEEAKASMLARRSAARRQHEPHEDHQGAVEVEELTMHAPGTFAFAPVLRPQAAAFVPSRVVEGSRVSMNDSDPPLPVLQAEREDDSIEEPTFSSTNGPSDDSVEIVGLFNPITPSRSTRSTIQTWTAQPPSNATKALELGTMPIEAIRPTPVIPYVRPLPLIPKPLPVEQSITSGEKSPQTPDGQRRRCSTATIPDTYTTADGSPLLPRRMTPVPPRDLPPPDFSIFDKSSEPPVTDPMIHDDPKIQRSVSPMIFTEPEIKIDPAADDRRFRHWIFPLHEPKPSIFRRHTMPSDVPEFGEVSLRPGTSLGIASTLPGGLGNLRATIAEEGGSRQASVEFPMRKENKRLEVVNATPRKEGEPILMEPQGIADESRVDVDPAEGGRNEIMRRVEVLLEDLVKKDKVDMSEWLRAELAQIMGSLQRDLTLSHPSIPDQVMDALNRQSDLLEGLLAAKTDITEEVRDPGLYAAILNDQRSILNRLGELSGAQSEESDIARSLRHTQENASRRLMENDSLNAQLVVLRQQLSDQQIQRIGLATEIDGLKRNLIDIQAEKADLQTRLDAKEVQRREVAEKQKMVEEEASGLRNKVTVIEAEKKILEDALAYARDNAERQAAQIIDIKSQVYEMQEASPRHKASSTALVELQSSTAAHQNDLLERISELEEGVHDAVAMRTKEYEAVQERNRLLRLEVDTSRERLESSVAENSTLRLSFAKDLATSSVEREQLEEQVNTLRADNQAKDTKLTSMAKELESIKRELMEMKLVAMERQTWARMSEVRLHSLNQENVYWRQFALESDRKRYKSFMATNPFHQSPPDATIKTPRPVNTADMGEKTATRTKNEGGVLVSGVSADGRGTWWDIKRE